MNVSELIRMKRIEKDKTLEEVGAACGVGKSTVRKWENGIIKNIGNSRLAKLADFLDIPPAALIDTKYFTDGLPYSNDEAHVFCAFRELVDPDEKLAVLNFLDNLKTKSGRKFLMQLEQMDYRISDEELKALQQFRSLTREGQAAVLSYLSFVSSNPAMVAPSSDED